MPVSKSYNLDNYVAVQEFFHSNNWTDGLPVVPPTPEAVKDLLEWSKIAPEHLIGIEPVRSRAINPEKFEINALIRLNSSVARFDPRFNSIGCMIDKVFIVFLDYHV